MKKVGILSMQRIANYGSFLQAYGLKNILEELGCEVQFVDFHPGATLIPANGGTGLRRIISKVVEVIRYDAPVKEKVKYIIYKKNFASNNFLYLGLGEENFSPKLDVLIIGSDEVFNCVQDNSRVGFSPELFGANNNADKVITYAASFGNTTIEKLEQYNVDAEIAKWLEDIDAISVRDQNSGKIVRCLTGREPVYNLDPVLMYDFIGKCAEIPSSVPQNKYMILYGYSGRFSRDECRQIEAYAHSRGLKVFCIGGIQHVCDTFVDCSPFQVIAYFQHADCVVTDTFHGSILSVITHRQFVSVVRNTGYGNKEKMTDVLERLHLENRIIENMNQIEDEIGKFINFKEVDEIIKNERERCYAYLRENI